MTITMILLILALICFVVAAFGVASRIGLVPTGLALCTVAAMLAGGI